MSSENKANDARKRLEEKFGKIEKTGGSGAARIAKKSEVKKVESKALTEIQSKL